MTRRMITACSIGLLLVLLLTAFARADKSYSADRFDLRIDVEADGTLIVTETVVFRFVGGPFTFAFRDLALTELDQIDRLQAAMEGQFLPPGTFPGQVEIQMGRPIRVTWHFEPLSDATREFTLQYRVQGAIRQLEADTLIWRAVPEEHDYPITSSTVTLSFPSSTSLVEAPALDRAYESSEGDGVIRLTTREVRENESVVLSARFASGSLIQVAPVWQAAAETRAASAGRAAPLGLAGGLFAVAMGGLALAGVARRNRQEIPSQALPPTPTPPMDLPAAVVGKLTGEQTGFLGTLFDLSERGHLEIHEERRWLGTRRRTLRRNPQASGLRPHEEVLLEALFEAEKDSVDLSQVGMRLALRPKPFDSALDEELAHRTWLDPAAQTRRRGLRAVWILVLLASIAVLVVGGLWLMAAFELGPGEVDLPALLTGVGAGMTVVSLAGLVHAARLTTLTVTGVEQAHRWKAFKAYLQGVVRGREPAVRPDLFERYLPYAAAFGLGTRWGRFFQKLGGVPLPAWFHAIEGTQGDFGSVADVLAMSDSSAASAAGGGGAAGASGGGASGAG